MARQVQKSAETRARIVEAGRAVFARDGYAAAALGDIANAAQVTTGAIYHHFGGKKELFTAVAEHLEQRILEEVAASAAESADADPWTLFENGVVATLAICARDDVQRIVFREAPTVVGPAEWREIELRYSFGLMRRAVSDLAAAGAIQTAAPELTAQVLLGAVIEAAHGIALADDRAAALPEAQALVRRFVRALKARG